MAWIDRERLEQLEAAVRERDELRVEVVRLSGQLAVRHSAEQVLQAVERDLAGPDQLSVIDDAARDRARKSVHARERDRLITEKSDEIEREVGGAWAAAYRQEHEPSIVASLKRQFEADGTFERIRMAAEEGVQASISESVIAAARADIAAEVEAGTQDYAQAVRDRYLASPAAEKYRSDVRQEMERRVDDMTPQQVQQELRDEELARLLRERAEREKAELASKSRAEELTARFEKGGIDTAEIEPDSTVVLSLGELDTISEKRRVKTGLDPWSNPRYEDRDVSRQVCRLQRQLTLCALGDGRFIVNADSLSASHSPHEQKAAIPTGTVIVVGRQLRDTGEVRLDNRIAADVELFYDEDTSSPHIITDTFARVANVSIDGIPARQIDNVSP